MNLIAAVSVALFLQAPSDAVKGTVSVGDISMQVLDATAVWDPAKGELRIVLLPIKVQPKYLPGIQKGSTRSAILEAPSPDPKKWPDWSPAAEMRIAFKRKDATKGPAGVESYQFFADWLTKRAFVDMHDNLTAGAAKEFSKLNLKPDGNGGGTLTAVFSRKGGDKDSVNWDVSVTCPVLSPIAEK
jgi:hypothetical protein